MINDVRLNIGHSFVALRTVKFFSLIAIVVCSFLLPYCTNAAERTWWKLHNSGTNASLRGVSVACIAGVSGNPFCPPVVWVSGAQNTILRSTDRGESWQNVGPAKTDDDAAKLDFRGIVAFNQDVAYAMSSGEGSLSRIYKTADGGKTWTLQYKGERKEIFLDSISCLSPTECVALGDPVDGKFLLLRTTDGEKWSSLPKENLPEAFLQEGAFAASNSCLLLRSDQEFFLVTGGARARVLHTRDGGKTWSSTEPPVPHGQSASGIFSITVNKADSLLAISGGNYAEPNRKTDLAAYSRDDGKTWKSWFDGPAGYRSAISAFGPYVIAVGTSGSNISEDGGKHWSVAGEFALNAVTIQNGSSVWAVGPNGAIASLIPRVDLM